MNKRFYKIIICIVLLSFAIMPISNIFAADGAKFNINDILSDAKTFYDGANNSQGNFLNVGELTDGITKMIFDIGNLVILIAMAIMGLRYVWSGVEGKASIKESMVNMSVGVIFFYMAQGVYKFASGIISGTFAEVADFSKMSSNIWGNVALVVQMLALIGLAAVGLKYMFSNSNSKADIKKQLFPVVVGLVLIFCVTNVANFIINASGAILGETPTNQATASVGQANAEVKKAVGNIYATVSTIFQFLAVAAVVFTGVRYMLASADTRADIKGQCIILLVGAMLVFGGAAIIKAVGRTGSEVLGGGGGSTNGAKVIINIDEKNDDLKEEYVYEKV